MVTASVNGVSTEATASVTVIPGPAVGLAVAPIEVSAGLTHQLQAFVAGEYGNPLERAEVTWNIKDPNAGSITSSGVLTAGDVAGEFGHAIEAYVTDSGLTATSSVTIIPAPLTQVVIGPNPAAIGIQITQQFVALGADQFGNRIADMSFGWSVQRGGGSISRTGLFTAGTDSGTSPDTVKAETSQGDITVSATATVIVEPDRIAFLSDRDGEVLDLYLMNADDTNIKRLTTGADVFLYSWSPDGRRLIYDSIPTTESLGIFAINDDGDWNITVLEGDDAAPAWSPDGEKIAFSSLRDGDTNIYVMDIDGGNQTRLTDDPANDKRPAWSPDGEEIAFVSSRQTGFESGLDRIWIMDSDGMNQHALTINPGQSVEDTTPSWSPGGTQIAFQSGAAGGINYRVKVLTHISHMAEYPSE